MKLRSAWLVLATLGALSGCSCDGCGSTIASGGKGQDAGGGAGGQRDGGGALDGGNGGGQGGGSGGGVGTDGGDGSSATTVGPGGFSLDGGSSKGEGVKLDPSGYVVLDSNDVQLHFMWIANNTAGTVSKFDTRTGKEVARYHAAFPLNGQGTANGLTGNTTYGHHPSRTAIDLYGDVWIANRAPGKQGSVTKVANAASDCKDRNGNGKIDTSRDTDGSGAIDPSTEMITPSDWSNPAQYDECLLFTTPLGTSGGEVNARAIAISTSLEGGAGHIWVGLWADRRVYKLRATDGVPQALNAAGDLFLTLSFGPYGAAVDGKQRLWIVKPGAAQLALIDTAKGELVTDQLVPPAGHGSMGSYGIAIDGKDRVWLPGWGAGAKASRYDHGPGVLATAGQWIAFDFTSALSQVGTAFGKGRGIAADDQGFVWMSGSHRPDWTPAAQLIAFDQETGAIRKFQTASGPKDFIDATDAVTTVSIGVGLDGDGQPWVNNYSGNAMKIDRTTGAITRTAQQTGSLYTYSDFTGYQLRKFTAPRGTYRHDFQGCGPDTEWRTLRWTASTPAGTSVEAYVKVANTPAALSQSATLRYGPLLSSPADLKAAGVPRGGYARVEFVLKSLDGQATPSLQGFQLDQACGFN